jgi:tetratricopeptide (TPR) repeat protein
VRGALGLLGALLVSAAPMAAPDDLVRQGNAAYARSDYATAVQLYGAAEERSLDPGLVAVDEAAALYELGRYAEAARHYRLSLQDATGSRRTHGLFGLANSLVQKARDKDAVALREAIHSYQECLVHDDLAPDLAEDVRHNLEVAKLLYKRARAAAGDSDPDRPDEANTQVPPTDPPGTQEFGPGDRDRNAGSPGGQQAQRVKAPETGTQAMASDQPPAPGAGHSLPPVPDQDELAPMSPEDAAAHVRQATDRILRERRQYQSHSLPATPPDVKNW